MSLSIEAQSYNNALGKGKTYDHKVIDMLFLVRLI